jgi:hypothetical protein
MSASLKSTTSAATGAAPRAARRASLDGPRAAGKGDDEARKSARALADVLHAQGNEAGAAKAEASVA